jgi:hypothetical protein
VAPVAEAPVTLRPWLRAVGAVAGLKIVLGLLGMIVGGGLPDTQPGRDLIYLAHVLAFTVAAAGLALGGRNDRRAGHLALFFLLIASEFADRLLLRLGVPFPGLANPLLLLGHLQVEALLPYVLWLFVQDFPRVESGGWSTRVPATAVRLSLLTAGVLAALNLIHANALLSGRPASGPIDVAAEFSRYQLGTLYHAVLFALMLPALGFLVRNRRLATADERRRVGLLLAGLVAGAAPMLLIVIVMSFWPAADALLSQPRVFHRLELLVYAGTLSIPATTAYAVLVRHALDVRLVVRKAVGYALARYTILAVALAPLAGLVLLLFAHRDQPLGRMLTGPVGGLLLLAATAGLAMLALRRRLLAAVDRRFFREEYDAAQTLHALAEGSRAARDVTELEEVLVREIDRALHVESGALLVRAPDADVLASPSRRSRPLATMSTLAKALDELSGPLLVTAPAASPVVEGLPLEDRQWLSDGGFRLLLPMIGTQGLLGLLALGGKRSELPYSREDRLLLATVALSARATLETQILSAPGGESAVDSDRPAAECATCGTLAPPGAGECPRCPGRMQTSKVPLTLRDKFRLEARVGRGGMGVVYRATDLHLGRLVAVKTLPWVAPYLATRLRREARAMAAVAHPNLAMIYGVEFFHGVPMLVVEYLARGHARRSAPARAAGLAGRVGVGGDAGGGGGPDARGGHPAPRHQAEQRGIHRRRGPQAAGLRTGAGHRGRTGARSNGAAGEGVAGRLAGQRRCDGGRPDRRGHGRGHSGVPVARGDQGRPARPVVRSLGRLGGAVRGDRRRSPGQGRATRHAANLRSRGRGRPRYPHPGPGLPRRRRGVLPGAAPRRPSAPPRHGPGACPAAPGAARGPPGNGRRGAGRRQYTNGMSAAVSRRYCSYSGNVSRIRRSSCPLFTAKATSTSAKATSARHSPMISTIPRNASSSPV